MASGHDDNRDGVDGGTVVESLEALRQHGEAETTRHTVMEPSPGGPAAASGRATMQAGPLPPTETEPPYRPIFRPPVPRLIILDDGEQAIGQTVRLREEVTVIGRTEGDVRLPHDLLVSTRHAEIVRRGRPDACRWMLRDLGSSNGTFVACTRAPLRPDRLVMLGSRRYRFCPAQRPEPTGSTAGGTMMFHVAAAAAEAWPSLVEVGRPSGGVAVDIPLRGDRLVVGRRGGANDVAIDDPLVAPRAAQIFRDAAGAWHIEAQPSRNGLWMQVVDVELASMCRFQVGEQRFLFMV